MYNIFFKNSNNTDIYTYIHPHNTWLQDTTTQKLCSNGTFFLRRGGSLYSQPYSAPVGVPQGQPPLQWHSRSGCWYEPPLQMGRFVGAAQSPALHIYPTISSAYFFYKCIYKCINVLKIICYICSYTQKTTCWYIYNDTFFFLKIKKNI